jgi:hypothetical protein
VAAQHVPAVEAEEQVLAASLNADEAPPVEPLRNPLRRGARMRRLYSYALPHKRLEAARRTVEDVSLGHAAQGSGVALPRLRSRPQDGATGAGEKAGLHEQRQDVGLRDGLAVETLDREPLQA